MKKTWAMALIALVVAGLVAVTMAVLAMRASEDAVTAEMVELADSLAIPPDSVLLDEVIRREQTICLDTNPCPSMQRRWQMTKELTITDLQQIVAPLGVAPELEGDCLRHPNAGGENGVCAATAIAGDFEFWISVISPDVGQRHRVSIDVRPAT